jgi:LmeA-like phospholipid-binding
VDRERGSAAGWLLGTIIGLLVLAVGADVGLRLWTEAWLAGEAQRALRLDERPDVDLHGFPFLAQFMEGVLDRADLEVQGLREGDLVLDRVAIEGRQVHFSRRAVFGNAGAGTVRAEEAVGKVDLSDDAVSAYLEANDVPLDVTFLGPEVRASGSFPLAGAEVEASAISALELEGSELVFRPQEVEVGQTADVPASVLEFSVDLPAPIEGMTYQHVEVGEGIATLTASFDRLLFRVR